MTEAEKIREIELYATELSKDYESLEMLNKISLIFYDNKAVGLSKDESESHIYLYPSQIKALKKLLSVRDIKKVDVNYKRKVSVKVEGLK